MTNTDSMNNPPNMFTTFQSTFISHVVPEMTDCLFLLWRYYTEVFKPNRKWVCPEDYKPLKQSQQIFKHDSTTKFHHDDMEWWNITQRRKSCDVLQRLRSSSQLFLTTLCWSLLPTFPKSLTTAVPDQKTLLWQRLSSFDLSCYRPDGMK